MPELYEVVGSILRDIAQARCLSDLYSRDISRYYAVDEVLRNFPVPRAEINEASFTLSFVIDGVTVDETRQNIRNARLSQVFERSASDIVRSALTTAREVVDTIGSRKDLKPEQRAALDAFASGFLSEEYRIILRARFVRYFEENRAAFIADESLLRTKAVTDIKAYVEGLSADPLMQRALAQFPGDVEPSFQALLDTIQGKLNTMADEFKEANEWAKDFKIDINVDPARVQNAGQALCTIAVKTTVRNYTWSKVDEDPKFGNSLRTLQPE